MTTHWTLIRTTAPTSAPVSLQEAKSHLRISQNDPSHDENLSLLIDAATERFQRDIDTQIISCSFRQDQCDWTVNGEGNDTTAISLRIGGVTAVSSIQYIDADGSLQTLDPSQYRFDQGRSLVLPAAGAVWPELMPDLHDAVQVTFSAGVQGGDCVPRLFKSAILLTVGKYFYDPAQESSSLHSQETAYKMIVRNLLRTSYP